MVLIGNYQVATISRYKFRMPTSTSWFSSTTDVILKVFPAFWTHFVFFGGVRSSDFLHMDFFHIACHQKPLKNQWKKRKPKKTNRKIKENQWRTKTMTKQAKTHEWLFEIKKKKDERRKTLKTTKKRMNNQIRTNKKTMREIRVTTNERIKKPTQPNERQGETTLKSKKHWWKPMKAQPK